MSAIFYSVAEYFLLQIHILLKLLTAVNIIYLRIQRA